MTPPSNTGSKYQSLEVAIDWVQFVIPVCASHSRAKDAIAFCLSDNDAFEARLNEARFNGRRFAHWAQSARGAMFMWNLPGENGDDGGSLWGCLPGGLLAESSTRDVWRTLLGLNHSFGAKFKRIDIRIDDYSKSIAFEQILEAYERGDYARFQRLDYRAPMIRGELEGQTIYMGSTQSEKLVRYYDKNAESKGELDCYRLEVQFRDDLADAQVKELCKIPGEQYELVGIVLGAIVTGAIDFVDRSTGERLSRCERLPWWQEFLDRVGGSLRVAPKRPKPTLERTVRFFERVSSSLATVRDCLGPQEFRVWLGHIIDEGKARYSPLHEALLKSARLDQVPLLQEAVMRTV